MPSILQSVLAGASDRARRLLRGSHWLLLGLLCVESLAAEPIKVFLMAGQSNMRGRASTNGLPQSLLDPQEDILICRGSQGTVGDRLEFLSPNSPHLSDAGSFGPDLTFGRTIADTFPDTKFALLKYAVGATGLGGAWAVNPDGAVYLAFQQTVTNGLALLEAQGYEPEIVGMLWHQGESNIGSTQAQYENLLNTFIAANRAKYGANLPYMIAGIAQIKDGSELIIAAQQAVGASDPFAVYVPGADLSYSDVFHLDRPGMITMGERLAAYYSAHFESLILGADTEPTLPTLSATTPANGGTIEVFDHLEAAFSEMVLFSGTGSLTLKDLGDSSGASDIVIPLPDPQVTVRGKQIVIHPAQNLPYNTHYAVRISADAIVDLAGNPFAGILSDEVWFFQTAEEVPASLVVYEPFEANQGALPGSTPGFGLTGTWAGSARASLVDGLSYGELETLGGGVQVTDGWSNNQVGIAASPEYAALLADGGQMWFSILLRTNVDAANNNFNRFAFGIGSSSFGSNGNLASGQAIGFGNSRGRLYAGLWETTNWGPDNLQVQPPDTAVNGDFGTVVNDTPTLIVGRVQWGADATSPDVVTLYLPGSDLSMGAVVATSSGIVDQSTFNTVMTHNGNGVATQFDEIRIGATYADVVPAAASAPSFADWQAANGTTGSFADDHDGDGVPNGIEFFLSGANNTNRPTLLPGIQSNGGNYSITWNKSADFPGSYGVNYLIEVSTTLAPDSWTQAAPARVSGDVTYTFAADIEKQFVRLKVME
ncbi:MAG: sialate O-acetylesterase [Opitutales bacterium]